MKLSVRASIPPQVMTRILGEEVVVLDLASGSYYGLNPVGARIWQLMGEGKTLAEICEQMLPEYDVSRHELEHDALKLAKNLESYGLITLTTG
jgi:hypothetical protein